MPRYHGAMIIAATLATAGKAEPGAVRDVRWTVDVSGVEADQGPKGQESRQSPASVQVVGFTDGKVVAPVL
jgi:hypothetical protein